MDWADVPGALADIESGKLRDIDQIRIVLAEAKRMVEFEKQERWKLEASYYRAQTAFLEGWPDVTETAGSPEP